MIYEKAKCYQVRKGRRPDGAAPHLLPLRKDSGSTMPFKCGITGSGIGSGIIRIGEQGVVCTTYIQEHRV